MNLQVSAENQIYFDDHRAKSIYYARIGDCCNELHGLSDMISGMLLIFELPTGLRS